MTDTTREAIIAGLRGYVAMQPDFTMSRQMMKDAADHIMAEPGLIPLPTLAAAPKQAVDVEAGRALLNAYDAAKRRAEFVDRGPSAVEAQAQFLDAREALLAALRPAEGGAK